MSDSRFAQLDAAVADVAKLARELQAEDAAAPKEHDRAALDKAVRYLSSARFNTSYLKDML